MNNSKSAASWIRVLCLTFALPIPCLHADALDQWSTSQVCTNGFQLSDIIYAKGLYVTAGGAGDGGTILTSKDGVAWSVRADGRSGGNSPSLVWSLAYGGGRFVTVGHFGGTASSTNGTDWLFGKADTIGLTGVAYGAGTFAAVGSSQGNSSGPGVFISSDGVNWSRRTLVPSETRDFFDIAYGAGKFVATAAGGYIYTSGNGATWTRSATTNSGQMIVFCNNLFIVSSGVGTNLLSTDGVNWTAVNTGLTNRLGKPIYASGLYIARTRNDFAISRDGTNWTQRTLAALPSGSEVTDLTTMATDGQRIVTVGTTHTGIFQYNAFAYRSDPLVSITMTNNGRIALCGLTGSKYSIEWTDSLAVSGTNSWQTLTNLTLSNSPQSICCSTNTAQRYYRAALVP